MTAETVQQIALAGTALTTLSALLANFFPPETKVGKALHWLGLNGPTIQTAVTDFNNNVVKKLR